jgi:O-antigen/teichoic acid export membrane protein
VTPVLAALYAAYARFFEHGASGLRSSLSFGRRLLGVFAGYGLVVGVALFVLAPLAPLVLGSDYGEAAGAIRWLAPLPLLQALGYLAGDSLTGAGYQGLRSGIQLATVGVNIVCNLWLIPLYSWRGAAWATLISYALLAGALWTATLVAAGLERRQVPA